MLYNNCSTKAYQFLSTVFWLFSLVTVCHAKMVYYFDEAGKIHYVNTDYSKVPDRYGPQVRRQLEKIKAPAAEPIEENPKDEPAAEISENATIPTAQPLVEVFVQPDCLECRKLEINLKAKKIFYKRYDINYDHYGQQVYAQINGELPFTRIGEEIIYGNNIKRIEEILKQPEIFSPEPSLP